MSKALTWSSNAVVVQAGDTFRIPLLVVNPSVLAIQFEVRGSRPQPGASAGADPS